jgi:ribonuclease P/MRP protein subunit RPP40
LALTSALSKIAKRCVRKNLEKFFEDNNLITTSEDGFRKNKSCLSKLLCQHRDAIEALETNSNLNVIYIDYAKAFDRVDHGVVFQCLRDLAVTGCLGQWCAAFLKGRRHSVLHGDDASYWSEVGLGVPQGSVSGQLFFVVLINTLPDATSEAISVQMFANALQADLDNMYKWNKKSHLLENHGKFKNLQYGNNHDIKYMYDYTTPRCNAPIQKNNYFG